MPGGEKTYKVNGDVYTIPESESGSFLKDFPNAMEIKSFVAGKDTFDIPVEEVPNFLKEVKGAKEIGAPEPAKPSQPLPSIEQQMPDMGIKPVGTFKKDKPLSLSEQLTKGAKMEQGVLTVHDTTVPRSNKPDIGEAVDNLLAEKNKGFNVSKEGLKIQKAAIEKAYKNGDLALTKDAKGRSVLKKGTGFLSSAIDAINNVAIENIHNNILADLDNKGKRDYLAVKDILDQKYKSNSAPAGAAGKIGEFVGENADILAKGAVGAMTAGALAPAAVGASNFGSFVAMADQFAKGGYSGELQKTYHALVAQGVPEEQAMDEAHKVGLLGEATGLATGAVLSGIPKTGLQTTPAAAKGFLKAISKSAGKVMDYEMSKMGAVSGAQTFINDLGEMGVGVKKKPEEILNEVGESAAHGAVIGAAFFAMMHPGKVLSFFRPQAENVIASMPKEQREAYIKTAEQNEVLPKGSAEQIEQKVQEFSKAKEPVNNLPIPEENKAAIAGKILQKQKLQEELSNLSKHGEAFAPRIEELTNEISGIEKEIAGMYKAKDVFTKEQDSLTGEKITDEEPLNTENNAISEQSPAEMGIHEGWNETAGGQESGSGVAEGNAEELAGARGGQEEGQRVEGPNIETVSQKGITPVKEFVSKQGHTLKNDGGVITVTNKAGKEVSRGTRKKVIREAAESYDFTQGKEATEPEQPLANDEEYKRHVVENSTHPAEIATLYINEQPEQTGLSSKEQMIADYGMGKVTEQSYRTHGDKNTQNHNKARAYFSKEGTPIDSLAKEIGDHYGVEITPQDVVDFIDRFPNGADAATAMRESDAALSAKDRFSELTGLPLDKETAEIAIKQQFEKLSQEAQDIAKQDYDSREQLEAEYWKHFETNGSSENGPGSQVGSTEAAKTDRHYEEIAGSKPTATGRITIDPVIGGQPKQISHIIRDVSNSLNQKLFFARPGRRKAIGTYAPGSTAVKIRFNGDLDTTAHELGHSLDDAFGIIADLKTTKNPALENELRKFSGYGSTPPAGHPDARMYKLGEGFAEWLRARVVNPTEAIKQAPELNKIYEAKVSDKFKKGIDQFSIDVRTWAGASGRDITLANIEWKPEEAKGIMQKLFAKNEHGDQFHITFADKMAANFINPMHAFEKAWEYAKELRGVGEVIPEEDPTILSRLLLSVDSKFGEFLKNGLRDSRDVLIKDADGNTKTFKWLLEPLDNADEASIKRDMQDTIAYMVAERTVELSSKYKREDVLTGIGGGVFKDIDVARKAVDEFKNGDPERLKRIEAAAERYRSFSDDILRYMVDKGRLSEDQYQAIKANNVQYVALRRVLETEPDREIEVFKGSGGKLSSVAQPVKTIKGSSKTIANPYISLLDTMNKSIKEADRNDVMKAFTDMLVSDRKMYEGAPEKLAEIAVRGADGDKNTITVFHEGKPEKWIFQDDVYKALKGLDNEPVKVPKILTLHAKVLRATVTKFPVFALRNIIRDTPDRIIKSTDGSGFKDFFGDKQHWRDLARNGGLNAGFYVKDKVHYYGMMEHAMQELTGKGVTILDGDIFKRAWEGYENILQKSETSNRVAEYRAALRTAKKKGMDDYNASLYAAFKARDLMDFALMGHWMKVINKVVPFSNAAVQGLRSTYNSAAKNPLAFVSRIAIYTVIPQVTLWAFNHKDKETADQYEEMPEYQRDMFFNFKIGQNKWAAIPKPYELGMMAAAVDRSLSKAFKYNDRAFDGYAGEVYKTLSPIDIAALTGPFQTEVELMTNYSFFADKHIIPEDEQPLDLSLRNTKYASRLGQALQRVAGIDARKADYWLKSHFSYVGDVAIKATNIGSDEKQAFDATSIGLIKRTPAYNSKSVQDMLDFAAQWGLGKTQEAKYIKSLAHEYFNVKSDQEKETIAKQMIEFSKATLAAWKPIQEQGGLKSQQKAETRNN